MSIDLYQHQLEAIDKLQSGSILVGGVGSGKSRTSLAYYFIKECGGEVKINGQGAFKEMKRPKPLYIITTAKKRDDLEWRHEALPFLLSDSVVIDSWNNIAKYVDVKNAFFIFDEQRLVGSGTWVKSFLKIARTNNWILLTATPGDTWNDYIPVFVANGFYKNRTDFLRKHAVYNRFSKFPKVDRYTGEYHLNHFKQDISVLMPYSKPTTSHEKIIYVPHNESEFKRVMVDRWNIFEDKPVKAIGELFYLLRKVVNRDPSRLEAVKELMTRHPKLIIFYNFDYELETLRTLSELAPTAEWNGHLHQPIPSTDRWVYLVQYSAGAEGWNCIETDVTVFYSMNYSYKTMVQSAGRIDRLNTKFKDLYYYHIRSRSQIDVAIAKALKTKKNFNIASYSAKWASRENHML